MKTVTIALEDELYETARAEAEKRRKSLGDFMHDVFWSGLAAGTKAAPMDESALTALWSLADARPATPGSAGPLNRDSLYERGLSGH
jgi:hypothetical protein